MSAALQRRLKALEQQHIAQTTIRVEHDEVPFPDVVVVTAATAPDNQTGAEIREIVRWPCPR